MLKGFSRLVQVTTGLYFEYEVSPHRAFLAKMAEKPKSANADVRSRETSPTDEPLIPLASAPAVKMDPAAVIDGAGKFGDYVPFKQFRLKGQINPLRPPVHVETVLIGRALGQPTGYLFGVGFRVRDDGYVEAEFPSGVRKFTSYEQFEIEVTDLVARTERT